MRGGESYHNYGLAVDIVPTNAQGKPTWQASREVWEAIGRAGERQGLEWGGRWTGFSDVPHFQFAGPTKAAKELLPIYKQGGLQ
ncbi:M15 family metallopeptidase, partial [Escherichia coli]|nr:M15 family metallopeptidase [Escherichia coli]